MEETRFTKGSEQLEKIDGAGGEAVIKSLEDISPDLGKFIIEFAFGDIYTRPLLNLQERELITITSEDVDRVKRSSSRLAPPRPSRTSPLSSAAW